MLIGIDFDKKLNMWRVRVYRDGKTKYIGRFKNFYTAKIAFEDAKTKILHQNLIKREKFLYSDLANVGILDIETSGLKPDFALCLCAVIKEYGGESRYVEKINISSENLIDAEKEMIESINNKIIEFDGIITYYGSRFDIPFLRTRALVHGLEPIPKIPHLDMYYVVKNSINPSSRRLDRINDILRISNFEFPSKTKLEINEWNKIILNRDNTSLDYIVDHCIIDVDILENVVKKLSMFVPQRITRK